MAVITGGRAVAVSGDVGVGIVSAGLLVRRGGVAVDAGEARVVCGNLVAIVADGTVVRNREVSVVKCCAQPTTGGMAGVAGGGIARGNVIGDAATERLRAGPGRLMAPVASRVRGREGVIVVDVACRAWGFAGVGVCACERPAGGGVVELSVSPI